MSASVELESEKTIEVSLLRQEVEPSVVEFHCAPLHTLTRLCCYERKLLKGKILAFPAGGGCISCSFALDMYLCASAVRPSAVSLRLLCAH